MKGSRVTVPRKNLAALKERGIKALVIACNTATSAAVRVLREENPELIIVGIEPAIKPASEICEHPRVIVMATALTLREEKFKLLVNRFSGKGEFIPLPCHGLVELIEQGDCESDEIYQYLAKLFAPYKNDKIDGIVLGCTHYPHVRSMIAKHFSADVKIIDGGEGTAIAYIDESGNVISIACSRSFTANLIQSNPQVKSYYNELKNHILSYKGVKARMSWRLESFNKGRTQLFKLKIRGKTICMYCALNPDDFDEAKYFHERATAKNYAAVPMMVRIKSDRGLKRAKALVDMVMAAFSIPALARFESVDYAADYPYDTTKSLVERKLIKLLLPDAVAAEPKPHHHVHKKTVEVVHDDVVEEITIFEADDVQQEALEELIVAPTPALDEIDFDDASEEIPDFEETPEHPGVDVIGVVWPEKPKRNKIYRYDPDGESVSVGDIVIVPTRDAHKNREVIRKAAVAHANHKIDPETLSFPLKKILGVLNKKPKSEGSSGGD